MPPSLNEIGIRNPEPRVLSMHLEVGRHAPRGPMAEGVRKRHYAFRADGLLFCTPTGSPAYCYSCGGRQMKKADARFQAVAISPFRRTFAPLMLARGARCTMRMSGPERAQFFIDGHLKPGKRGGFLVYLVDYPADVHAERSKSRAQGRACVGLAAFYDCRNGYF